MRKSQITLLLAVLFLCTVGSAQNVASSPAQSAAAEVAAENAAAAAPAATDVVIVQQQQAVPVQAVQPAPVPVVEQPTTVVTASPLTVSRAEELRKARERMEIETEQKIVEKLEAARLADEQRRMENLFGNKLDAQPAPAPAPAPAPEPVAAAPAPQKSEEELKNEIAAQVRADLEAAKKDQVEEKKPRWSIGGVLSTIDYPDAMNVGSDFGAGVVVNWIGVNRVGLELAAIFSQSTMDVDYSLFKEINQQNWSFATKYYFMDREFTPVAGALLSFTHREYRDMYQWGQQALGGINSATTDSLDAGLLVGVQFTPSKNMFFALDYRWLTNIESRYSEPRAFNRAVYQNNGMNYRPLEEIDYQLVSFSMNFIY